VWGVPGTRCTITNFAKFCGRILDRSFIKFEWEPQYIPKHYAGCLQLEQPIRLEQ